MAAYRPDNAFKLFGFLHRRNDFTLDAFRTHWRTTHAEHALKLTDYMSLYIQNHALETPLPGFRRHCDGSPEIWFETIEKLGQIGVCPEYMEGAYLDEPEFMEGRAAGVVTTEEVLLPGAPMAVDERRAKALVLLKRAPEMSFEDFHAALRAHPAPVVAVGDLTRHIRSYALAPDPDEPPLFDAVEEYWWADPNALAEDWGAGALADGAGPLIDRDASAGMQIEEIRPYWPAAPVDFAR